jgi:hypothetical protein
MVLYSDTVAEMVMEYVVVAAMYKPDATMDLRLAESLLPMFDNSV